MRGRVLGMEVVRQWIEDGPREVWRDDRHERDGLRGGKTVMDDRRVNEGSGSS
jgi:hypothetical protein